MSADKRLRWCPRCAGKSRIDRRDWRRGQAADSQYRVICTECHYSTPWEPIATLGDAVDIWNEEARNAGRVYQPLPEKKPGR